MKRLVLALVMLWPVGAVATNSYLCVVEQATGFIFKNGSWKSTDFYPGEKYIVRRPSGDAESLIDAKWMVLKLGWSVAHFFCKNDFTTAGYLFCDGVDGPFKMNAKSLRFQSLQVQGYVESEAPKDESDSATPSINIGKCSPLD